MAVRLSGESSVLHHMYSALHGVLANDLTTASPDTMSAAARSVQRPAAAPAAATAASSRKMINQSASDVVTETHEEAESKIQLVEELQVSAEACHYVECLIRITSYHMIDRKAASLLLTLQS